MMNKFYDIILGWPGLLIMSVVVFVGIVSTATGESPKEKCESAGGKWTQTMKSYHTCKMPTRESANDQN